MLLNCVTLRIYVFIIILEIREKFRKLKGDEKKNTSAYFECSFYKDVLQIANKLNIHVHNNVILHIKNRLHLTSDLIGFNIV